MAVILGDPRRPDAIKLSGAFTEIEHKDVAVLKAALATLADYNFRYLDDHDRLFDDLQAQRPDFVLNFCDNGLFNRPEHELHIPALLEMLKIPYSGAGPQCLAHSYDKGLVGAAARAAGVPVPAEMFFTDAAALGSWTIFPALIKPNRADNSFGITGSSLVRSHAELAAQAAWLRKALGVHDMLVQEFLPGREFSLFMIGNPGAEFFYFPVYEWTYPRLPDGLPPILTRDLKFNHAPLYKDATEVVYANLDETTLLRLRGACETMFIRLSAHDYARLDFRADAEGVYKLMEFNPNPSWNKDALVNDEDERNGFRYADILRLLLETAQTRYAAME